MSNADLNGTQGLTNGDTPEHANPTPEGQQAPDMVSRKDVDALRQTKDRELATKERQLQEAQRAAYLAAQREKAALDILRADDPKKADAATQHLAASAVMVDNQLMGQELAAYRWRDEATAWAVDNDLDLKDPQVKQALANLDSDALERIHNDKLIEERAKQLATKMLTEMGQLPQQSVGQPTQPAQPRPSVGALPPQGGSSTSRGLTDEEHQEYQRLTAEPTKNAARIKELESKLGR